ncbi:hypothetical protein Lepto7376_3338 [[Leptolyngbya] sp. PCC 7376]|uniref:hypothetical protein n=1 Tax=[Leptolyngbya] sp. PCC 7376 TaxID=111781 RepID=UPI00029F4315|nr:hypothetical protein [[Leptolyngbya] sp. PCC 7376]AFY39555.1 hypothetical protein Lepto7376_3338 [[Leptolyngbya] sp. PCC 7376]
MKILTSFLKKTLFWLYPIAHLGLATIDWFLIGWSIRLNKKADSLGTLVLPVLLVSLSFDNFVLGAGWAIGEGNILERLSMFRFLFHYLIVPFFIVVGVEIAHEAGARWANKFTRVLSWIVAVGLAIADVSINYVGLELEPTHYLGMLRYTAANLSGPPLVTIAVNVFMLVIAIGVWIRMKWSILFVGTLIAFIGNAITAGGTLPGSAAETIMALSLLLTEQFIQVRDEKATEPETDPFQDFVWEEEKKPYQLIQEDDKYKVQPISVEEADFYLYQAGNHKDGDFIQAYVPKTPQKNSEGKLKVIAYLHGFALGLPRFYQIHLAELAAKEGCYVLFPDFQVSTYSDELDATPEGFDETSPLTSLFELLKKAIAKAKDEKLDLGDIFKSVKKSSSNSKTKVIARKLIEPSTLKYVRVSISLTLIILAIRLTVSLVNKKLGDNFVKLVTTVAVSLAYSPQQWGDQAFDLTAIACKKLSEEYSDLQADFDFYVFGHSLGGLLALSWPYFYERNLKETQNHPYLDFIKRFQAKQIVTADPSPSTEMGVPGFIVPFLKIFNIPFLESPVKIADTGEYLEGTPVGILHGESDRIVRPKAWVKTTLFSDSTSYDQIKGNTKAIYFSVSKPEKKLVAFHNQALTDTTYFSEELFKNFGGVKTGPNAYNFDYVWQGLSLVTQDQKPAHKLLKLFDNGDTFDIVTELSTGKPILERILGVLGVIGLFAALYWLFTHGLIFA